MDQETRNRILSMMFGEAAPMMDIDTCARVMFKPFKDKPSMAWLPIGWQTHQPIIFVMAQDNVSALLNAQGRQQTEMTVRTYICMDALPQELKDKIREHLGLKDKKEEKSDDAN
jgi:hypothetical protein